MNNTLRTPKALLAAMLFLCGAGQALRAQPEAVPDPQPLVRLNLASADSSMVDEALIHFGFGEPGADMLDVAKSAAVPQVPVYIATERADGEQLEMNAFGPIRTAVVISLRLDAAVPGEYTLTFADLGTLAGLGCFLLESLHDGSMMPVWQGASVVVDLEGDTGFLLHAYPPMEFSATNAPCADGLNGTATVLGMGPGPWDIMWVNYENVVVNQNRGWTGPATAFDLPAGIWKVIVSGNEVCGTRIHDFVIGVTDQIEITAAVTDATCPGSNDGSIILTVTGGTAPYTSHWSTHVQTDDLVGVPSGVYNVSISDYNDCVGHLQNIVVGSPAPIPGELIAPATAQPGHAVPFFSTAAAGILRSWDFGDGTTSMDDAPMHAFANPGTYTVTLYLSEAGVAGCRTTLTRTVVVQSATGIDEVAAEEVRAFTANGNLVLLNTVGTALDVRVFDAKGRIVGAPHRVAAQTPRWELPTRDWTAGVYVMRVQSQWEQWSFSLPVTD